MSQTSIDQAPTLLFPGSLSTSPSLQRTGLSWLLMGWRWRVAAILMLFAIQGLWLTVRFDTAAVTESSVAWGRFFRIAPMLPRIGISLLVAIPFLGKNRIRQRIHEFARAALAHRNWWIWWLSQCGAFALLTVASVALFDDGTVNSPASEVWAFIWITSAVASCACCLCSLVPPRFWCRFAWEECRVLLASFAISLCATCGGPLFQLLWNPLGDSTFRLVEWWLSFLYSESIVSDAGHRVLGTQSFNVHIAPQCSGYEGIGLISVFVLGFLVVFRTTLRFPHAGLLWPIGVLAIWICNSLRIAALIVIGTEYSASLALGGFHSQAGWILFNLVSIGLMAGALQSGFFTRTPTRLVPPKKLPAAPYLVPFLVLTAVSMMLAALVDHSAMLYPLTVVASLCVLWMCRDVLRQLTWDLSPRAVLHGIIVYIAWTGLALMLSQPQDIDSLPTWETTGGFSWTIFRVFGAVITVPIIEELAFRGFLLRRLVRSDFETVEYRAVPLWAILVSSLAFGLLHEFWVGGLVAGISYAWLMRQRGNLADPMVAHAITNGLLAVTVLWTGATWLW